MEYVLGVDVGGTKVATAFVAADATVVGGVRERRHGARDRDGLVAAIALSVRKAQTAAPGPVLGVGLACAGTVDRETGTVVASPNLPLKDDPLAPLVEQAVGLPVVLDNDVNAALMAEARLGAARGARNAVMITLGTGVGGALLIEGKIHRGAHGGAGEIGHMIVDAHGDPCRCGGKGCLEAYVAAPGFERIGFRTVGLFERGAFTGELIGRLAEEGSAAAKQSLETIGWWLGVGISNVVSLLDPEVVIVGGGLGSLGEMLLDPARRMVRRHPLPPARDLVRVEQAELGTGAGAIGAGLLAWERRGVDAGGGPQ